MTENPTFEGRYTVMDRIMQIPAALCIAVAIYCWGMWVGIITY